MPGEEPVDSPDLIGRDFTATAPGERLVGDITYLKTDQGWLYLATVIDLCSRTVVGWQLAEHMRTSLIVDALAMAADAGHARAARSSIPTAVPIHVTRVFPILQANQSPSQHGPDRGVLGTPPRNPSSPR